MRHDLESNLISIEIAKGKINNVIELGNFLIHVDKNKKPLLVEILDGGKFIGEFKKIQKKDILKTITVDG